MNKQFNSDEWFVWEQNSSPMLLILTLNPSFQNLREYLGSCLFNTIVIFETDENNNYQGKWVFRYDEGRILGQKMVDMLLCPLYMVAFNSGLEVSEERLLKKASEIQSNTDNIPLLQIPDLFDEFCSMYYAYYRLAAFTEPVQWHTEYLLSNYLNKHYKGSLSPEEALKYLLVMESDSFTVDILRDICECARCFDDAVHSNDLIIKFINNMKGDLDFAQNVSEYIFTLKDEPEVSRLIDRLSEHSAKYFWKNNNYYSTHIVTPIEVLVDIIDPQHFIEDSVACYYEELLRTIENEKVKQLQEKAKVFAELPSYYQNIVSVANRISELIDTRKKNVMTCNAAFDAILSAVADYTGRTLEELHLLIPQELRYYVEDPTLYKERFEERRKLFVCLQSDFPLVDELIEPMNVSSPESILSWKVNGAEEPYIAEGDEALRALDKLNLRLNLFESVTGDFKEVQGVTAFYHKTDVVIEGVVRVMKNPKVENLENGEILVAPSTTPDYINAISKCKAIVTDWGGQTSHAAIVAREMKKPCIIGTNFASQVLRTGMNVRIDFAEGTIEVLK